MNCSCCGRILGLLLLVLTLNLSGCVRVDAGSPTPTLGEQIMDLAKARERGVITQGEFAQLRRELLQSL
ncbi:MAG: hypothetical protein ACI8PP_003161 [Candidatus Pseudothioglobus sp.]|jgi:hypothetical protein